jgi:site-specific recombinase XerD
MSDDRLPARIELTRQPLISLPSLLRDAGDAGRFAFEEFFYGQVRNRFTRKNYLHALRLFSAWCEQRGLDLVRVTPADVGRFLDSLPVAIPTRKVHLAALRRFFDELVLRHVLILNPALSVRGERHQVIEGRTPEMPVDLARRLLQSIDVLNVVGLRDRAVIGVLIYTAARVGAVARLRRGDFYDTGDQFCLRFTEKGGKVREIPVRHDLLMYLRAYLDAAGLNNQQQAVPLFRSAVRRTRQLTNRSLAADDIARMVQRRLRDAGSALRLSSHSFRVMTITDLLTQGVPLADVQYLAGHADPRTTQLYDRRQRRVTRNIVERISI